MSTTPGDSASIDFIYRYTPSQPKPFFIPRDGREVESYLRRGNELIVRFNEGCKRHGFPSGEGPSVVELSALEAEGFAAGDDGLPVQMPFAVMLGCADARVPTELLFGQEFNDIFNIRVAGNVLAEEVVGSLLYAIRTFAPASDAPNHRSLKLAGVLGHRGCGAVRATIRAFLDPLNDAGLFGEPIGAILRRITSPALIVAADTLNRVFGPGAAGRPAHFLDLVDLTVYLNAAWVAHEVQGWVGRQGPVLADQVGVVYGVVDPHDLRVRALPPAPDAAEPAMFGRPPKDQDGLRRLALDIAHRLAASRPAGT
jgi:carbonic anhydrase